MSREAYFAWCVAWITEGVRLLRPGGSFFVYGTPELAIKFAGVMGWALTFRHWIALSMKGTFPRGRKLYPAHYALLYYTKGEPSVFNRLRTPIQVCRHCGKDTKDYGGHRGKMHTDGISLSDFWDDTSPNRHHKHKVRPGVNELKSVIPERAILMSTNPWDLVLDPFGGGGTTYQVAEEYCRRWVGIEKYDCSLIGERFVRAGFIIEDHGCFVSVDELFR